MNPFESIAERTDEQQVGGERIIDFDVEANTDYEIQSSVVVDEETDTVKEASVRLGKVEERPDLNIDRGILFDAFSNKVRDTPAGDVETVEADMSDFQHNVPHIRVGPRENIEEFGMEAPTTEEFAQTVEEAADFTEDVLRADDKTIDNEIDDFL
jgi:hypothetical protein